MNRIHRWFCRSKPWRRALERGIPWVLEGFGAGEDLLEIGSGPGLTTDILRRSFGRVTAVEIDPGLAATARRSAGGATEPLVLGDGTALPFPDASFSGVVCFTMLHHVPSVELQDRLLSEARRVLRPGGVFAGSDSRSSLPFRLFHLFDTLVPVDPDTFGDRLLGTGFHEVRIDQIDTAFRFRAVRPR